MDGRCDQNVYTKRQTKKEMLRYREQKWLATQSVLIRGQYIVVNVLSYQIFDEREPGMRVTICYLQSHRLIQIIETSKMLN